MTVPQPSDVSLYELAITSEQPPQPMQLSPTTFKSMVGLLFDFLLDHNQPATVWLKLPKGEVWQAEYGRFCQFAQAPCVLYNLHSQAEEAELQVKSDPKPEAVMTDAVRIRRSALEAASSWDGEADITIIDELALPTPAEPAPQPLENVQIHTLPLAADSQLRREYFVMVATTEFYGLVLAHRPRSIRGKAELPNSSEGIAKQGSAEETLERKHPLLGICSFDAAIVQSVLDGINRAIYWGQSGVETAAVLEILPTWEQIQLEKKAASLNPLLLGKLLVKQIHRQEELWRSGAIDRQRARRSLALQEENERLHNLLRLKDEFIQMLGQELRTPLTTMKTALTLLNSPSLKPQQRQRYMDMLSQECDRQSSLITSGLSLTQIESTAEQVVMEPLRLVDVVPGVIGTYLPLAEEKKIRLGYTILEDLPPVSSYLPWLKQIVINLLHNSIKFTPSGGQVWVKARQQGESVQIEFRDSGIGIAPSEIPKIFDRFYRVRHGSEENGAGLGLTITQQLVIRSGGSISVRSRPGEGSAFLVTLPIYRESNPETNDRMGGKEQK